MSYLTKLSTLSLHRCLISQSVCLKLAPFYQVISQQCQSLPNLFLISLICNLFWYLVANTLAYSTKSELNRRKNIYEIQFRFCDHFWGQCDFCLKGTFSIDIFAVFLFIYFDSSQSGNEDITDNLILKLDFYTKRKKTQ